MEITRSGILMDCLEDANRQLHKYSKHGNGLLPLEGYENIFDDLNEKCRLLRAMIIENQAREEAAGQEEVHASRPLADWQMEIIKRDAERAEDGPIRRMMVSGGTEKQEPAPTNMKWNPKTQAWEQGLTPDEAVLRRRYRNALTAANLSKDPTDPVEGWRPGPVVYPGGEE